jgi:hypothetical protein
MGEPPSTLAWHHGTARTADEEAQTIINKTRHHLPDKPPQALRAGMLFEL